jgi:hypothetical protein
MHVKALVNRVVLPTLLVSTTGCPNLGTRQLSTYYEVGDYDRAATVVQKAKVRARSAGDFEGLVYASHDALELQLQTGKFPSEADLVGFLDAWTMLEGYDLRRSAPTDYLSWSSPTAGKRRHELYAELPKRLTRNLISMTHEPCFDCSKVIEQTILSTFSTPYMMFAYADVIAGLRLAGLALSGRPEAIRAAAPHIDASLAKELGFTDWLTNRSEIEDGENLASMFSTAQRNEALFEEVAAQLPEYGEDVGLWDGVNFAIVDGGVPVSLSSTQGGAGDVSGYMFIDGTKRRPLRVQSGDFFMVSRSKSPIVLVKSELSLQRMTVRAGPYLADVNCKMSIESGEVFSRTEFSCPRYSFGTFALDLAEIECHTNELYIPQAATVVVKEGESMRKVYFFYWSVPAGDYVAVPVKYPTLSENASIPVRVRADGRGTVSESLAGLDSTTDNFFGQLFIGVPIRALAGSTGN